MDGSDAEEVAHLEDGAVRRGEVAGGWVDGPYVAGDRTDTCWHADRDLLSRYVRGEIEQSRAMALEDHFIVCSSCRASLGQFADPAQIERNREAVLDAINAPRRGLLERLLIRAGMREGTARLVVATPALRASWLAAVTVALGFAVVAAASQHNGFLVFLVVAPLLPVTGVAAAYGPGVDPTYEIGLAAPLSSLRLLLLRAAVVLATTVVLVTTVVLATTVVLLGFGGLSIPRFPWTAVVWLLPALGLTTGSIALSTVMSPLNAARLVILAWLIAVAAVAASSSQSFVVFRGWAQIAFALLAAGAGLVIAHRREALDHRLGG